MTRKALVGALILLSTVEMTHATSFPTADVKNSADSEVVGRLSGAVIVDYLDRDFDEVTFPLSELKPVKGKKIGNNNRLHRPDDLKTLEGRHTRIVYFNPPGASSLKVIRAYQKELESQGATELYGCKGIECGGRADRAQDGGGGNMTLGMYLWPPENVKGGRTSPGRCAQMSPISDQRYSLLHVPGKNAYVSIHAYELPGSQFPDDCNKFRGSTVSIIDIVKLEELEAEFVTVKADKMASEISSSGKIALYGILFDSGKADLKPESTATLNQIAALLKEDSKLHLLIVGHTDTEGTYEFNLNLSQQRANAVVANLVESHSIGREQLFPVGVSFASPLATNATEEGRAKNRRVELVKF